MKIYNKSKTELLENPDLASGYLTQDTLNTHHDAVEAVEEKFHWEVTAEYPNGGKDLRKVVDVPGIEAKEAYDEEEDILVYIPFTDTELHKINTQSRITELKKLLADTDYKCMKHADGELTDEEYEEVRLQRRSWRAEINELEKVL